MAIDGNCLFGDGNCTFGKPIVDRSTTEFVVVIVETVDEMVVVWFLPFVVGFFNTFDDLKTLGRESFTINDGNMVPFGIRDATTRLCVDLEPLADVDDDDDTE